jgi:hypothetical protein
MSGVRWLLWSCLMAIPAAALAQDEQFAGKRIVPVVQEPRHRVVYQIDDLYLLDVQIQPGDTTLPHTHDSAILYTHLHGPTGPSSGRVISDTRYVQEPLTHEVSNEGPGLLHILALANYGEGRQSKRQPDGTLGAPVLQNPWFASYRIRLRAGEETGLVRLDNPSVVVQVHDGKIHVTREDGLVEEMNALGNWVWRDSSSPFVIRNLDDDAVEVVVNEARR